MITLKIIEKIIYDIEKNVTMLDVEKADMLRFIMRVYPEQCEVIEDEINDLIKKWD